MFRAFAEYFFGAGSCSLERKHLGKMLISYKPDAQHRMFGGESLRLERFACDYHPIRPARNNLIPCHPGEFWSQQLRVPLHVPADLT